jgi:hypothetical protein
MPPLPWGCLFVLAVTTLSNEGAYGYSPGGPCRPRSTVFRAHVDKGLVCPFKSLIPKASLTLSLVRFAVVED